MTKRILVTGAAGFIGYHLCERLIELGHDVVGLDNINDYYDVNLKYARLSNLGITREQISLNKTLKSNLYGERFSFIQMNLQDQEKLPLLFYQFKFDVVCNLAAQAGVRYSIKNPLAYVDSNIVGFANLLECIKQFKVPKLIYASSSSVYGMNDKTPFSTCDNVDHPISMYAATKKSNELMAHTYSHLFAIETIGLRFFTVYGPWGRPDMAMFLFTEAILNKKPIKVFNNGKLSRDFTYIDDIVEGIILSLFQPLLKKQNTYKLFNIGNSNPVPLIKFIECIEDETGLEAEKVMTAMQDGDVLKTYADITDFQELTGYKPTTAIEYGVKKFVDWYISFYNKG